MQSVGKRIFAFLNYPRTFPVYLCIMFSKQKHLIEADIARWNEIDQVNFGLFESLNWYLTYKKEFRNLIQHRFKHPSYSVAALLHFAICRILWKPLESLYIYTTDIGGGLYIQHGFATIITAESIGKNVWINQQVTIGYNGDKAPIIGDDVVIYAGAKVVGGVRVGNNVTIGANAVVTKDIPNNSVVGGVPAKILKMK